MLEDQVIHKQRNWIGTIVTMVFVVLVGVFVWRVVYFTKQIKSGGFDPSVYNFTNSYTTLAKLASQPVKDGSINVVTKDDPSLGNENAPITIVEFADFGCPYSKDASFVLRSFVKENPDTVRFIYRDFPLVELHPMAQKAAEAAACAEEQGKFWEYHDKLYQNQNDQDEKQFIKFANELNLDIVSFESCVNSGKMSEKVTKDYQAGLDAGVRGTPTFFVNGLRIPGSVPKEVWDLIAESSVNSSTTK